MNRYATENDRGKKSGLKKNLSSKQKGNHIKTRGRARGNTTEKQPVRIALSSDRRFGAREGYGVRPGKVKSEVKMGSGNPSRAKKADTKRDRTPAKVRNKRGGMNRKEESRREEA